MKIRLFFALFSVLFSGKKVSAEGENDVKRGVYPYMAFLYYPDETVVDAMGARFIHGAVIIKPDWLVSSAIDHSILDNMPLGFPRKTLLARAGAVAIDQRLTLNEDEDEQEREIITIVRPSIHNVESWWLTDITLLKTLLPFKMTSAVSVTSIDPNRLFKDKNCIILVYAKKYGNATEDKVLMQLAVELLPASIDNCGNQFSIASMTCAMDGDETKNAVYDPDFCQGNSGGPLLCEGEVMALQTYIENNCRHPHLYQLLSASSTLIPCSINEKCNQPECANICSVIHKDNLMTRVTIEPSTSTSPVSSTEPNEGIEAEETTEPTNTQTVDSAADASDMGTEMSAESTAEDEKIKPEPTTLQESTIETTMQMNTVPESMYASDIHNQSWPKERLTDSDPKGETKTDDKENWNPNVERQMIPKSGADSASLSRSLVVSICAIKSFYLVFQ